MSKTNHPQADRYIEERQQGKTYKEIADKYGVSHQAVSAACAKYTPDSFKPYHDFEVIYPNLRRWLNENRVSRSEFVRRMGLIPSGANNSRIRCYFRGVNYPSKQVIDKMLEVTGLTYEEMFQTEGAA